MEAQALNLIVLLPCFNPDFKLLELVKLLSQENFLRVLIVDDGSGKDYESLFETCKGFHNLELLRHGTDLGKGRAIKTGLNHIMTQFPDCQGALLADCNGQHSASDILAVAQVMLSSQSDLVLGYRNFDLKAPLKSRIGNSITAFIFRFLVGLKVKDTQTGLRGLSQRIFPSLLKISGERFEYETNMLLEARNKHWRLTEVPIQSGYARNLSWSFNPFLDSMRIYFLIFRFLFSSIASAAVDFSIFSFLIAVGTPMIYSVAGARFISGWINFFLNKNMVFQSDTKLVVSLIRYWSLALVLGSLTYGLMSLLQNQFPNVYVLKLLVESLLFLASFSIQKEFVFGRNKASNLPKD